VPPLQKIIEEKVKMKAVQISKAGGNLELVERDIPKPKPDWVRVKVEACGVCHSDQMVERRILAGTSISADPGS
jgi:D-arabinose 1-dehydrogenase-like Zn-dependent alcohol dehydrogenase